jgi:hypothetical protein
MKRYLLALLLPLPLCACPAGTAPTIPPATVIIDLQNGFAALSAQLPGIAAVDPKLAAEIAPDIAQAQTLLAALNAASPNMTNTLATVDGILNTVLSTASGSGLIPPPYDLLVEALSVLAPEVEAVVNPLLTPTTTAAAVAPVAHPDVANIDAARGVFAAMKTPTPK